MVHHQVEAVVQEVVAAALATAMVIDVMTRVEAFQLRLLWELLLAVHVSYVYATTSSSTV